MAVEVNTSCQTANNYSKILNAGTVKRRVTLLISAGASHLSHAPQQRSNYSPAGRPDQPIVPRHQVVVIWYNSSNLIIYISVCTLSIFFDLTKAIKKHAVCIHCSCAQTKNCK